MLFSHLDSPYWQHLTSPTTFLNQTLYSLQTQKQKIEKTHIQSKHSHQNQALQYNIPQNHCISFVGLMENSYTPFSPTTATTTNTSLIRQPNVGWSHQNSEFFIYEPMNSKNLSFSTVPLTTSANSQFHHPQYQSLQVPFRHPIEQAAGHSLAHPVYPCFLGQNGIEFGASSSIHASNNGVQESCFMQTADGLSKEQERRILDPYTTKVARIKRKLARQRSLSLQRNASPGASNQVDTRRLTSFGADRSDVNNNNDKRDLYKFCTPDNKRLRVLLKKELKNSDVGSLGRIVLPKREAEANLPTLSDKEGIQVTIKDVYSSQVWTLRYKFWSNNKSRMYVIENTGDFVKQNRLEMGDSLTLYEDESKNLYFSITKVERINAAEPSNNLHHSDNENNNDNNQMYLPFTCQSRDEEETSLELLIEQLKHKEQQDTNNLMTLPMDAAYSYRPQADQEARHFVSADCNVASIETYSQIAATTIQTSSTLIRGKARSVDDIPFNFDDCYGGLDMLPDVNHYNFSL